MGLGVGVGVEVGVRVGARARARMGVRVTWKPPSCSGSQRSSSARQLYLTLDGQMTSTGHSRACASSAMAVTVLPGSGLGLGMEPGLELRLGLELELGLELG